METGLNDDAQAKCTWPYWTEAALSFLLENGEWLRANGRSVSVAVLLNHDSYSCKIVKIVIGNRIVIQCKM